MSVEETNKQLRETSQEYRVEFLEHGGNYWTSDAMTFDTFAEATQYGMDIMNGKMTTFTTYRIARSSDPLDPPVS